MQKHETMVSLASTLDESVRTLTESRLHKERWDMINDREERAAAFLLITGALAGIGILTANTVAVTNAASTSRNAKDIGNLSMRLDDLTSQIKDDFANIQAALDKAIDLQNVRLDDFESQMEKKFEKLSTVFHAFEAYMIVRPNEKKQNKI